MMMIQKLRKNIYFKMKFNVLYKYSSKDPYFCIAVRNFQVYQLENELAHNVLLSLPHYSQTTVNAHKLKMYQQQFHNNSVQTLKISSSILSESAINKEFQGSNPDFESHKFYLQELYNLGLKTITKLSDDEFLQILLNLVTLTPIILDQNSKIVFESLLENCIKRSKNWTINQILLVADIWYNINISKRYYCFAVEKLFSKVDRMNTQQFTQSFFYLNLCRTYQFGVQKFTIEKRIEDTIDRIGIEELGVIALGLFKSKNFIHNNNLLQKFVTMLVSNKKHVSDSSLSSLFKILKKSISESHLNHELLYSTVVMELQSEIKNMNNYSLMQLASLGNYLNMYDVEMLNIIFDQFSENIHSARLKELERFSFILMNLGTKLKHSARILQLIESELVNLQREDEFESFCDSLLSCVYYVACMGQYNADLISKTLKLNETLNMNNGLTRFRHLFELHQMLEIEGPKNYDGYKLSNCTLSVISKKCVMQIPTWKDPSLSFRERQFLAVKDAILKVLGGEKYIKATYTLPFSTTPDILFCTDKLGNLKEFPQELFNYLPENFKYKPKSELNWHAFVVVNRLNCLHNTSTLIGVVNRNIRLLKKLGYNVMIVEKWKMDSGPQESVQYLLQLLKTCLNKKWMLNLKSNGGL